MTVIRFPGQPAASSRYEQDFYSWALEQAELLAQGRADGLDFAHLAEEIRDLARWEFRGFADAYRLLLLNMLRWDYRPEHRCAAWQAEIALQRQRIDDILGDSPGLVPRIAEAVARGYREARLIAAKETELDLETFPLLCAYDAVALRERPFDLDAP
jgi:hypothetical protein